MKAARDIRVITYRNNGIIVDKQTDPDPEKLNNYKASSYINYQGDKLVNRFNAYSYWLLTKSMDSHNITRGRGKDIRQVLQSIQQQTLIIGINTDILCPLCEQLTLAENIPKATFLEIESGYGHDGFMVESAQISVLLAQWLSGNPVNN